MATTGNCSHELGVMGVDVAEVLCL